MMHAQGRELFNDVNSVSVVNCKSSLCDHEEPFHWLRSRRATANGCNDNTVVGSTAVLEFGTIYVTITQRLAAVQPYLNR